MPNTASQVSSSNCRDAPDQHWHAAGVQVALDTLRSDPVAGLTQAEAHERWLRSGSNVLLSTGKASWPGVLGRQFASALILILVIAAAVAFAIGEVVDAIAILSIVVVNAVLGFAQEWKAEKAIEALQRMLEPRCRVVRDRAESEIEASTLTPGDIVLLDSGDRLPADLRILQATNLKIDESALTGESVSVAKDIPPVPANTDLAGRSSMGWMGTAVTNGRARGLVVETGMRTEFGRIAQLTGAVDIQSTPLQRKLALLGKQLGAAAIAVSVLVAITGLWFGKSWVEMFLTGVSLAVAVVPEGLPAVVTIALALGIRAMTRRRALLRKLQAAETLGAATVICTDKTGTLTQSEMSVTRIWLPAGEISVGGVGYEPSGEFANNDGRIDISRRQDLQALLSTGLLCNHADIAVEDQQWRRVGEPTEAALVAVAGKASLSRSDMPEAAVEFSFNSERKRMTVLTRDDEHITAHVKGAPEVVLAYCTRLLDGDTERALTDADRQTFEQAYTRMAENGQRTLAIAHRTLPEDATLDEESVEQQLTLLGVVGIMDPPRAEVADAIRMARAAGIRIFMITGDAAATGLAIARSIGMGAQKAITGADIEHMDDQALSIALEEGAVFARTTPEHKLRIVDLLQQQNEVVAMTGDGVNDAPALKKADVGIAMGVRGTDVARGASDMVLTDDNFASIVGAVEEGRRQYDNIQKFVRYLLSSNTGEVVAIFLNILLGGPLILLPVQILWINLITDGVTAVALGVEPAEKGIMKRPPRAPDEPILDRTGIVMILVLGGYIGLVTLGLFHYYLQDGTPQQILFAQTVAFTAMVVLEKMNVFNFRALREPIGVVGFFSNPWILIAWLGNMGLQIGAVYVPFLQLALHTTPLGWREWGLIFLLALPLFLLMEIYKWIRWRDARRRSAGSPANIRSLRM